jgi:hypothetical protein
VVLPADLPLPLGAPGLLALAAVLPDGLIEGAALHHDDLVAVHAVPYLFAYPGESPESAWTRSRRGYAQSRAPFVAALADGLGSRALAGLRREALVQARAALSDIVPAPGARSAAELLSGALRHLEASVDAEELGCAMLTADALPALRRAACDVELALIALVTHATLLRCPVADRRLELLITEVHTSARDLHALHLGVRPWSDIARTSRCHESAGLAAS